MLMGTIWLVVASLVWGVVHSILASLPARQVFGRFFGRWYRLFYNIISVLTLLPVGVLFFVLPDAPLYTIPAPWMYLTLLLQMLGLMIPVVGVLQTGVWEFVGLKPASGPASLVTGGVYRYVRHPLYFGGLLFIWLLPEMTINRLALVVAFTLYIAVGAYFEEKKLLQEHGPAYAEYQKQVPMLIPWKFGRSSR